MTWKPSANAYNLIRSTAFTHHSYRIMWVEALHYIYNSLILRRADQYRRSDLGCTVPSLNCDVHCTVPHPLPPAGIKCLSLKIKCIPNTKDVRFVKFYKWKINGSATIEFKQLNLHFNFWNAVVMGIEIWKWKFELF